MNTTKEAREGLARIGDACKFLSLSRSSIYNLMDRGELRFVKLGRARRIPWPALEALIQKNQFGDRN